MQMCYCFSISHRVNAEREISALDNVFHQSWISDGSLLTPCAHRTRLVVHVAEKCLSTVLISEKKCSLFTLDCPVRILWRGERVGGGKNKEMDGVTKRSWRRGLRDCCHRRLRIGLEKGLFKSIQESIMLFCGDAEEKITS